MSKDHAGLGLLSKLVKFVRNPATSWSELDAAQVDKDDSVSKQLLKEMMERKRRNDFVRKREFDILRKIRKLEALSGQSQDQVGKPSFFQSSMLSPDDRASTLKKIDEIEAQMSMQWWKNKDQGASVGVGGVPSPAATPQNVEMVKEPFLQPDVKSPAYMTTVATQPPLGSRVEERMVSKPSIAPAPPQRPIQRAAPNSVSSPPPRVLPPSPPVAPPRSVAPPPVAPPPPPPRSSPSVVLAPLPVTAIVVAEPEIAGHDAELEEAAILFANGDDAGAEAGLLDLLAPGALRVHHVDTWLTLFDLYRATGEQEKFETAAIKFVKRFDRSAPQWFCLPDMVKAMTNINDNAARGSSTDWICPSVMGLQTVAALNAAMQRAAMPWRLDWSNLKTIDPSALDGLYKVFANWANTPVQLQFLGGAQLQRVLLATTTLGEPNTVQKWWLLRMQALRVFNLSEEFEVVALDFCVTYEVSPPAWESARCVCISMDAQGNAMASQAIIGEPVHSAMNSMIMEGDDPSLGSQSSQGNYQLFSVELSGHIQGDAAGVLDMLEAKLVGASVVQISCSKLIRVDFSAAGMLLNWVSARQLEQRPVKLLEVNRLVAAFFNVIGITEYAKVVVRVD